MKTILQINSSARHAASESTRMADRIVARLQETNPDVVIVRRDLASEPIPALDEFAITALATPEPERTQAQKDRVAIDDAVIAEVQRADVVVIGVPMYNFNVSVQLKSWLDAITRAGVTFSYSEAGPEGLLKNKKVYLALARGGMYKDSQNDTQVEFLKTILPFLGMTDIQFIYAEGLGMGPESAAKARAAAEIQIDALRA